MSLKLNIRILTQFYEMQFEICTKNTINTSPTYV